MTDFHINQCILAGRIQGEPQFQVIVSKGEETSLYKFILGVRRRDMPGMDFLPMQAFGSIADMMRKYFHAGDAVCVTASAEVFKWQSRMSKEWHTKTVFTIHEWSIVDGLHDAEKAINRDRLNSFAAIDEKQIDIQDTKTETPPEDDIPFIPDDVPF